MNDLNVNLENVNSRIARACKKAGRRAEDIRILAVSKRQASSRIRELRANGQKAFGENYVQEAVLKQRDLTDLEIEWHFIGPLQSNKTALVARHFQWVQSVDRANVLQRLSSQKPENLPDLNICLQVNIDREQQKSGALPEEIPGLAQLATNMRGLRLRGLMAIPRAAASEGEALQSFTNMYRLFQQLQAEGMKLDTLSMGMSADLEQAVLAGSTMVRVGTDLFGPRA